MQQVPGIKQHQRATPRGHSQHAAGSAPVAIILRGAQVALQGAAVGAGIVVPVGGVKVQDGGEAALPVVPAQQPGRRRRSRSS